MDWQDSLRNPVYSGENAIGEKLLGNEELLLRQEEL
jgi:hypothetical protein